MRSKFLPFALCLLLVHASTKAADEIYFSKIAIEQGLSQLSVMTIYQDELGIMWFGTREGISRYNGNTMEVIKPVLNDSNSLNGSLIKNICGNKNGQVFIHSQNGVNVYDMFTGKMRIIQRENVDAIAYGVKNLWSSEQNKLYVFTFLKRKFYLRFLFYARIFNSLITSLIASFIIEYAFSIFDGFSDCPFFVFSILIDSDGVTK
ncbi:MAG: two-component regulator propeller domain-containing protein [Paludibacteraceae bacterium]